MYQNTNESHALGDNNGRVVIFLLKKKGKRSLAVQWLGLRDFTAGDAGLIPCQGTKIPHTVWSKKKTKKQKKNYITSTSDSQCSFPLPFFLPSLPMYPEYISFFLVIL